VDWYTYSGFRRYHSECHVCHGPDGEGSTYAPALKDSVKRINYAEFYGLLLVVNKDLGGGETKVMPALGDNKTSCCYVDDIYVYLRARSDDSIERGRPGNMKKNRSRHRMRSVHVLATTTERKTNEIVAHLDSVDAGGQAGCL